VSGVEQDTPPVGEEIHLPGPTLKPLMCAVGITMMVIGTTLTWLISIVGLIIFLVTTVLWVRDTRHDIEQLPDDG
jgi:hypothetical protein